MSWVCTCNKMLSIYSAMTISELEVWAILKPLQKEQDYNGTLGVPMKDISYAKELDYNGSLGVLMKDISYAKELDYNGSLDVLTKEISYPISKLW